MNKNNFLIVNKMFIPFKNFLVRYHIPFIASMIAGLLTYMFALTNKLVNHDDISNLFTKGASLSSGRWGLDILSYVFPDFSMPWIYGIISILLFSVSNCIIIDIFKIKNGLLQALLPSLIISFPSLVGTFSYMFTISSYGVCFLCAVISVKLIISDCWIKKLISLPILIFSLSIYQSYISVVASLLLIYILQCLIKEDGNALKFIKQGIIFVVFMVIALGLYYLFTQFFLHITNTEFNSYASDNMNSSISIPARIKLAYTSFFDFFEGLYGLVPSWSSKMAHYAALGISGIILSFIWIKKKILDKLLMLAMIILIPLAIDCMYLVTSSDAIHSLVMLGFSSIYVLVTIILDHTFETVTLSSLKKKIHILAREGIVILLIAIATINIYIGNQAFLRIHLQYENAYSFYTGVMTQVKMTPGYDENSKIALVGTHYKHIYFFDEFRKVKPLTGVNRYLINVYSRNDFIKYYTGNNVPFATEEEIDKIRESSEFEEMPIYPYNGSVKKIDDYIVVKFNQYNDSV